ncbi:MAG TPA: hypothetical protein VJX67_13235 [Blastocatellia bacterium]|nr:hypothetical protein [Blastocatellia bacterium]
MQKMLRDINDDRLRVYIVWLPMLPGDSKSWAQTRSDEFSDTRVSYYWDPQRLTGQEWNKALGIGRTAWDVYLLYGPNTRWTDKTPAPDFWMHQLGGVSQAPYLNEGEFEAKVRQLLAVTK